MTHRKGNRPKRFFYYIERRWGVWKAPTDSGPFQQVFESFNRRECREFVKGDCAPLSVRRGKGGTRG